MKKSSIDFILTRIFHSVFHKIYLNSFKSNNHPGFLYQKDKIETKIEYFFEMLMKIMWVKIAYNFALYKLLFNCTTFVFFYIPFYLPLLLFLSSVKTLLKSWYLHFNLDFFSNFVSSQKQTIFYDLWKTATLTFRSQCPLIFFFSTLSALKTFIGFLEIYANSRCTPCISYATAYPYTKKKKIHTFENVLTLFFCAGKIARVKLLP